MSRFAKRTFDLVGGGVGLVIVSPLLLVISLALVLSMGRPIFYRQVRPGKDGQPFRVWKFRTMTGERDISGKLLPDGRRLTRLGRRLREMSLDELPQLFNVVGGSMSLVGPRPLLMRYLPRYSPRQRRRLEAKPGITGWAQVNGRNALDWETRLELDVWYVEHWSLWLDARILGRTVIALIQRRGVLAGAGAELDEFWGNEGGPAPGQPRAEPVEEEETTSSRRVK